MTCGTCREMRAAIADAMVKAQFARAASIAVAGAKHMLGAGDGGLRGSDRSMGDGNSGSNEGIDKAGD